MHMTDRRLHCLGDDSMTRLSFLIFHLFAAPLLLAGFSPFLLAADEAGGTDAEAFFQRRVAPILVGRCLECHGSEHKGGLDLRSKETALKGGESGSVIEPSDPESSLLIDYVVNEQMPPKKPLADDEIAVLKQWIRRRCLFPRKAAESIRPVHRKTGGVRLVVVATASRSAAHAGWNPHRLERKPHRPFRLCQAGRKKTATIRPRGATRTDPPRHVRPDRPAAHAAGGRRFSQRRFRPTPTNGWSTACWPRPITASNGGGTGWT